MKRFVWSCKLKNGFFAPHRDVIDVRRVLEILELSKERVKSEALRELYKSCDPNSWSHIISPFSTDSIKCLQEAGLLDDNSKPHTLVANIVQSGMTLKCVNGMEVAVMGDPIEPIFNFD